MTENSTETVRPYLKGTSINAFSGADLDAAVVLGRIQHLADRVQTLPGDAYRSDIVQRPCRGLLGKAAPDEPQFELQPHVVEELARIADDELPRYLFYRYRYDVFPRTRELDEFLPCVQIEQTSICNY